MRIRFDVFRIRPVAWLFGMNCLLLLLGGQPAVLAGTGHVSGGEDDLWRTNGGLCVVVARVLDVKELPKPRVDGTTHTARLQVFANIAGYFDPSHAANLEVDIVYDPVSVNEIPRSGAMVIAVLEHSCIDYDEKRPNMAVVPAVCAFMPGDTGSPLSVISGLSDRRVADTLDAIRRARANHLGAPATTPTAPTVPSTQPKPD
jgi:hypothetical protein